MPSLTSQVALLAIASIALAHPNPAAAVVGDGIIATTLGTAIGGALDPIPTNRVGKFDAVDIASPPEFLTIQVVNSHGDAITTSHAHATTGPSAISGNTLPGTIANGATAAFAVPTGWVGNVAINDAGSEITGDDSLIEANFIVPPTGGYTVAVADVDVSYVNGFSAAIVCSCSGVVVSGCNKNLDDLSTCPDWDNENSCVNPLRASTTATAPTAFFAPCEGAAYTYPNDGGANSFGQCQSGLITCCVGSACEANPKQPAGPNT